VKSTNLHPSVLSAVRGLGLPKEFLAHKNRAESVVRVTIKLDAQIASMISLARHLTDALFFKMKQFRINNLIFQPVLRARQKWFKTSESLLEFLSVSSSFPCRF